MITPAKKPTKRQIAEDLKLVLEVFIDNPPLAASIVRTRPWIATATLPRHDNCASFEGGQILSVACSRRDLELVRASIDSGSAINDMGVRGGATPIMHALDELHAETELPAGPVVELLLKHGARLDMVNNEGYGILYQIYSTTETGLFKKLIEHGALLDCYSSKGQHHLNQLIEDIGGSTQRRANVQALINAGVDLDSSPPTRPRGRPLWSAIFVEEYDLAESMTIKGARLTSRTNLGETIAHCLEEHKPLAWVLARQPDLLEARDRIGQTPLITVCSKLLATQSQEKRMDLLKCVLHLVEVGADLDALDFRGASVSKSPRDLLTKVKDPAIKNALRAMHAQAVAQRALREIAMAP